MYLYRSSAKVIFDRGKSRFLSAINKDKKGDEEVASCSSSFRHFHHSTPCPSSHLSFLSPVLPFIPCSIATSVTTVHHLLSHSVSGLLAIKTFQSPLAVDYLSSLIDQTLLAPDFPFKLGPRVFAFLREVFHYHDFSVANFLASLQVGVPLC